MQTEIASQNNVSQSNFTKVTLLTIADLDALYLFECATWPIGARASKESISKRFELQHWIYAAWKNNAIIGVLCWRLGYFDPSNIESFPNNFNKFANAPNAKPYNAAYVYNLSVHPSHRGKPVAKYLMQSSLKEYHDPQLLYLVGDGRCPSYNGSHNSNEKIEQRADFKKVIDQHFSLNMPISLNDFLIDPVLCFYYRMLNCHFNWVIKDFLPTDSASGGYRVIFYKILK